ncbi:hypothetical protein M405DRAFT_809371 [Rhizopogon salebrosus TDB-379]|nr:hypothetical protein M405DRAFT_809371 [Rhizopogon salebrosus TDB-379]
MKYLHPGSSPAWLFLHSSFCVVSVVRITHINKSRVSEAIRITAKRILKPDALSYYYSRGYASPPRATAGECASCLQFARTLCTLYYHGIPDCISYS